METPSLYRRVLHSPPAIDFSSPQGKEIFGEALAQGTMEGFFKLISYYQTQSEPAYCGLASLAVVLNALAIDPGRKWKGPWRWFDESMLDCCEPLEKVKARGISLGKLVCLAHCAGANVEAFRANQSHIDEFRKHVMRCSTSDDCHIISSYHRAALQQTGTGHFSPLGGYHGGKDMILILDVSRFKYPPHWVPLTLLWEAMNHVEDTGYVVEDIGLPRGFMLISRPHRDPSMLYTLSCKHENWINIAKYLMDDVPLLLKSEDVKNVHMVLSVIVNSLPSNFEDFIKWVAEVTRLEDSGPSLSAEEKARVSIKTEVLKQVQETQLFKHVTSFLLNSCCRLQATSDRRHTLPGNGEEGVDVFIPFSQGHCNKYIEMNPASCDVLTALLLSLPSKSWVSIKDEKVLKEIHQLVSIDNLSTLLQEEVLHLRRQLHILKKCKENKMDEYLWAPLS